MSFDESKSWKLSLHLSILLLLVLSQGIASAGTAIVGDSQPYSATERNNARLMVKDGAGTLHVVYYDFGIIHSFSNDGGRTWSSPALRITDIGRNPALAVDAEGNLQLVYKRGGITAYEIVHRSFNGTWSDESTVYSSPQVPVSRPSLAVDSSGDLHCVWQRSGYGATTNSEIWYRKRTAGSWGSPVNISNTYGSSEYPTLAMGSDDNVHVFWKDSGENISNPKMVLYRKFTAGTGWDADYTNVSNTTGNGSYSTMDPCAVVDSQNDVHLVWKDYQPGNKEIFYKKCTDGTWDQTPLNLSETGEASDTPIISIDESDNLTVAWAEKTDGIYYEVIVREYSVAGGSWSTASNISNTPGSDSRFPNMPAVAEPGRLCIWTEEASSLYDVVCWYDDSLSAGGDEEIPAPATNAILLSNHPNPFNPATTISFELQDGAMVSLTIHDASGRLVRTLVGEQRSAGVHHVLWRGRDEQNKAVSTGVYFSCLVVEGKRDALKMILLR